MSNVLPMSNARDWKYHASRINAAWGKHLESIFETGKLLLEAKEELTRDQFETMCKSKLRFGYKTGMRLKAIAEKSVLFSHVRKTPLVLPADQDTLYRLSQLDDETLRAKIADGAIHPKLERRDAAKMVKELRRPSVLAQVRDLFANAKAGLTADDVHNQLGADVPAHTVRGYISKLAKSGDLIPSGEQSKTRKGEDATLYMRNKEKAAKPKAEASKTDKPKAEASKTSAPKIDAPKPPSDAIATRDETRRAYVTFLKTLTQEEQIEELKKIVFGRELGWTTDELSEFLPRSIRIALRR